jgi:hypothetical protein
MIFFIGPFHLLIKVRNKGIGGPSSTLLIKVKQFLNTLTECSSFKILNNFSNKYKMIPLLGWICTRLRLQYLRTSFTNPRIENEYLNLYRHKRLLMIILPHHICWWPKIYDHQLQWRPPNILLADLH